MKLADLSQIEGKGAANVATIPLSEHHANRIVHPSIFALLIGAFTLFSFASAAPGGNEKSSLSSL